MDPSVKVRVFVTLRCQYFLILGANNPKLGASVKMVVHHTVAGGHQCPTVIVTWWTVADHSSPSMNDDGSVAAFFIQWIV
jgi:hypothetical protein